MAQICISYTVRLEDSGFRWNPGQSPDVSEGKADLNVVDNGIVNGLYVAKET